MSPTCRLVPYNNTTKPLGISTYLADPALVFIRTIFGTNLKSQVVKTFIRQYLVPAYDPFILAQIVGMEQCNASHYVQAAMSAWLKACQLCVLLSVVPALLSSPAPADTEELEVTTY